VIWTIMPFIDCWELTQRAAEDVLAQNTDVKLLLIDNGSTAETLERARNFQRRDRRVYFWRHAPQLPSLSATWNHALDFVWAVGGGQVVGDELAWVVNNDVRLHRENLLHLSMAFSENPEALFVSAVGVDEETWKSRSGVDLLQRGGPDFSCFLISRECHERYRFDEGFTPAYFEDNDYHRRMQLAGAGDKIYSVNVPYLHYGSATINRSEKAREGWNAQFEQSRSYYVRKWGGLPGEERYKVPFGERPVDELCPHGFSQDMGCDECGHGGFRWEGVNS